MSRYDPVTSPVEVMRFVEGQPHQLLVHAEAFRLARAWVSAEAEAPPNLGSMPQRRGAPKAKRPTTAQLAESLDSMLALLPATSDCLSRSRLKLWVLFEVF